MNKKKVILVIAGVIVIIALLNNFLKRTPEKLVNTHFSIDLSDEKYSEEKFQDEWGGNGDGYTLISLKLERSIESKLIELNNVQNLPFKDSLPVNEIPREYLKYKKGFYKYEPLNKDDIGDFKLLIYDEIEDRLIIYYQLM